MSRGACFEGRKCGRCGRTRRYVATRRCVYCQVNYLRQHRATAGEREKMRGEPCSICGEPMEQPCLDEDPQTGEQRGWLCHHCNLGIGHFFDMPELLRMAVRYLDRAAARKGG